MLYQHHLIATDNLPFAELKQRSLINPQARLADKSPDFSRRIGKAPPALPV